MTIWMQESFNSRAKIAIWCANVGYFSRNSRKAHVFRPGNISCIPQCGAIVLSVHFDTKSHP